MRANSNNILIETTKISRINISGSGWMGADTGPNIYSVLNPAVESITILGTHMERAAGGWHIQCPANSICLLNARLYAGDGLCTTNVSRYFVIEPQTASIVTNINLETGNDVTLNGHYINEAGRITADTTADLEIGVQQSGKQVKVYDWGAAAYMLVLDKDTVDLNNNVLKDPLNEADATLSGTPLLVHVMIGATPYYFKIYPTKT